MGERQEFEEYLREQVGFLRKNGEAFDAGDFSEAKQIAVTIRTLVREPAGKNRKSLLRHLRVKDRLRFVDTSIELPPRGVMIAFSGLAVIRISSEPGATTYVAPLDGRRRRTPLRFGPWWSEKVLTDQEDNKFSRRDFVLGLAHKEGGAHVDLEMDRAYSALARSNSLGWEFGQGGEMVPARSPVPANVRQIGWELQTTLEEQLGDLLEDAA